MAAKGSDDGRRGARYNRISPCKQETAMNKLLCALLAALFTSLTFAQEVIVRPVPSGAQLNLRDRDGSYDRYHRYDRYGRYDRFHHLRRHDSYGYYDRFGRKNGTLCPLGLVPGEHGCVPPGVAQQEREWRRWERHHVG
jgi:hypothetical protein